MKFFLTSVGISTLVPRLTSALTEAELAKFSADSDYSVTLGTENGATMHPSLMVTSDDSSITMKCNHVPPHATQANYDDPVTTYIMDVDAEYSIPKNPVVAESTTCLSSGVVGVAINGVSIFSGWSRPCTDAVEDESIGFDSCDGHPQEQGYYHYHYKASCMETSSGSGVFVTSATSQELYGVALDGFPIYNDRDADGNAITNSQLDTCHGYDPGDGTGYRYVVNSEFPYIIGCYKGTPYGSIDCHCEAADDDGGADNDGGSGASTTAAPAPPASTTAAPAPPAPAPAPGQGGQQGGQGQGGQQGGPSIRR